MTIKEGKLIICTLGMTTSILKKRMLMKMTLMPKRNKRYMLTRNSMQTKKSMTVKSTMRERRSMLTSSISALVRKSTLMAYMVKRLMLMMPSLSTASRSTKKAKSKPKKVNTAQLGAYQRHSKLTLILLLLQRLSLKASRTLLTAYLKTTIMTQDYLQAQ